MQQQYDITAERLFASMPLDQLIREKALYEKLIRQIKGLEPTVVNEKPGKHFNASPPPAHMLPAYERGMQLVTDEISKRSS